MTDETIDATKLDEPEAIRGISAAPLGEVIHFNDGAIDKLSELGKEASGVAIAQLGDIQPLGAGLPANIPIGIRKGDAPGTFSIKSLIEEYRLFPARKQGTAKVLTLQSFIDLVNRHKTADTAIFANSDWRKPSVLAVVDYHALDVAGNPAWLKHRVAYEFPLSDPWKLWISQNGEWMNQAAFAAFIEDQIADLSSPETGEVNDYERAFGTKIATPAELIQLSRGLQVFASVEVKNAVTLQSGEGSIVFNEEHRDAGGNKLTIPGLFILQIAPFFMGETIRMPVRLRYRLVDGKVKWAFQIYRPDLQVTDRVRTDLDIIRTKAALPVFEGFPEGNSPN